jgi:hypothetical protein
MEEGDDILLSGLIPDVTVSSTFLKARNGNANCAVKNEQCADGNCAHSMADAGETSKYLFEQVLEEAHFGGFD